MQKEQVIGGVAAIAFGLAVIGLVEVVSPPQAYREGPLQEGLMPSIKGLLYEGN